MEEFFAKMVEFAEGNPFGGGLLLGAFGASIFCQQVAHRLGFKAYRDTIKYQKKEITEQSGEIKQLKKELQKKDKRLNECHVDLEKCKRARDDKFRENRSLKTEIEDLKKR